eukprot:scaffold13658_cov57-Phaeocystis_antarctica.AAC.2
MCVVRHICAPAQELEVLLGSLYDAQAGTLVQAGRLGDALAAGRLGDLPCRGDTRQGRARVAARVAAGAPRCRLRARGVAALPPLLVRSGCCCLVIVGEEVDDVRLGVREQLLGLRQDILVKTSLGVLSDDAVPPRDLRGR